MPAIPLVAMGISAFSAYKQAKAQGKIANAQTSMMGKQSALSNEISGFARNQMNMSQPALSQAMKHYMTLATGNRNALQMETAPERNSMAESYRGAEQGINSKLTGPARDRAIAELYRGKAGNMGMLAINARNGAFGNLSKQGGQQADLSATLFGSAGNTLTGAARIGDSASATRTDANNAWSGLISDGTKAATGAYDWYKRSQGGFSQQGPYASGYKF